MIDDQAKAIFFAALELPANEWKGFLAQECQNQPDLQERVDKLLSDHQALGSIKQAEDSGTQTADHVLQEKPGTMIGSYKLLEKIGEGGFGIVYVAEQQQPIRRKVALKILKPGMDSREVVARFEAERQALALMDHPNIARVFDGGATVTGRPYFVMELVKGTPLTEFCDQKQLNPRQRLNLLLQICQAIQHAHQKGIIHRDLKPSNVLVSIHDTVYVPKVIDFGIAKAIGQELTDRTLYTGFAQMVGTPLYMSPEQAGQSGLDIDTRSDIYSLGVLLYELLTGTTPFSKEQFKQAAFDEIRRMIREEDPPKPSTRLSEVKDALPSISAQRQTEPARLTKLVRGELDWIVMKCLEKDRNRRYETVSGLAADLQRYLAEEPVTAGPPGVVYRVRKYIRKYRLPVATILAFVLLSFGAASVSIWLALRASKAEQAERDAHAEAILDRDKATASTEELRAMLAFFQDKVLMAARPKGLKGGLGKDVTLKQALDAAEPDIDQSFNNQPRGEAGIRHVLGTTFSYLGEPVRAVQQHERAYMLRRKVLGANHSLTRASMSNLASNYMHAGRVRDAVSLSEELVKLERTNGETENQDTLTSLNNLGFAYREVGRNKEALPILEEALQGRRRVLGVDHPDTLTTLGNVATCYSDLGQPGKALPLYEDCFRLRREKQGQEHPQTLDAMSNLGGEYLRCGRTQEAIEIFQQSLQMRKRILGPVHPKTLMNLRALANAFVQKQQVKQALPLYEEALQGLRTQLGADHPDTLRTSESVARTLRVAGRLAEAIPLYEQVFQGMKKKLGTEHLDTLRCMNNLALAYQDANRKAEAIALLEETVKIKSKVLGTQHPSTRTSVNNLASNYTIDRRFREASFLLENQLAIERKREPMDKGALIDALALLGWNRLLEQNMAQADLLLLECWETSNQHEPQTWNSAHAQLLKGALLLAQNNHQEAETTLQKAFVELQEHSKKPSPASRRTAPNEIIEWVVTRYESVGQTSKASEWRKKASQLQAMTRRESSG